MNDDINWMEVTDVVAKLAALVRQPLQDEIVKLNARISGLEAAIAGTSAEANTSLTLAINDILDMKLNRVRVCDLDNVDADIGAYIEKYLDRNSYVTEDTLSEQIDQHLNNMDRSEFVEDAVLDAVRNLTFTVDVS